MKHTGGTVPRGSSHRRQRRSARSEPPARTMAANQIDDLDQPDQPWLDPLVGQKDMRSRAILDPEDADSRNDVRGQNAKHPDTRARWCLVPTIRSKVAGQAQQGQPPPDRSHVAEGLPCQASRCRRPEPRLLGGPRCCHCDRGCGRPASIRAGSAPNQRPQGRARPDEQQARSDQAQDAEDKLRQMSVPVVHPQVQSGIDCRHHQECSTHRQHRGQQRIAHDSGPEETTPEHHEQHRGPCQDAPPRRHDFATCRWPAPPRGRARGRGRASRRTRTRPCPSRAASARPAGRQVRSESGSRARPRTRPRRPRRRKGRSSPGP